MSFFTPLKRVIKAGFINFWRNGVVALASILVFTVTLFVIAALILGNAVFDAATTQLKDKVDITVYFTLDAPEAEINRLTNQVESLSEVKEVLYKSRDAVLEEFRIEHQDDSLILQSLEELDGENPLRAELAIQAHDPSQYSAIDRFLENESVITQASGVAGIIDKVNFEDNRVAIERFTTITRSAERLGIYIALFSALITILVVFNTIRLAIYTAREEIGVMRLVGAGNNYIRGPFIVEGMMYGLVGAFFTLAILYPVTKWVSQSTGSFYGSIDLFQYYISNFPFIFGGIVILGAGFGALSSYLAVKKYLKL